jgi:transposase
MVGVTSIKVKESVDELVERLRQADTPTTKERLQVLYWLKQEKPPSISAIAKAIGKHRNTLQTWLSMYRHGGMESMLEINKSSGGVRKIPQWAENALLKRLQDPEHGFGSYGLVQQWLAQTLGVEAEYHAVYSDDTLSAQSQAKSGSSAKQQAEPLFSQRHLKKPGRQSRTAEALRSASQATAARNSLFY